MTTKHVGVDVSATLLSVRIDQEISNLDFPNNPTGHKALIRRLTKRGAHARVCLEATGNYSLDLSLALHEARLLPALGLLPLDTRTTKPGRFWFSEPSP